MISVNVRSTIRDLSRDIKSDMSQIPFATAKALTDTAKDAQRDLEQDIERVFDRPTPFTRKAIGTTIARKNTLTATVFVKDIQAGYLALEIEGGVRRPTGRALVIPGKGMQLNQFGNIPRNKVKQLLARKDTFSGEVGGVGGIWQRNAKGTRLLIRWAKQARYKPRFKFFELTRSAIDRRIESNFKRAFAQAVATKR